MLSALLVFNPDQRIVAGDALTHPYCVTFHESDGVLQRNGAVDVYELNDNKKESTSEYRNKLYTMISKRQLA